MMRNNPVAVAEATMTAGVLEVARIVAEAVDGDGATRGEVAADTADGGKKMWAIFLIICIA